MKALDIIKEIKNKYDVNHDPYLMMDLEEVIKELKALNTILTLYGRWLGHKISDFEFFTILNNTLDKYDLLKEVLK